MPCSCSCSGSTSSNRSIVPSNQDTHSNMPNHEKEAEMKHEKIINQDRPIECGNESAIDLNMTIEAKNDTKKDSSLKGNDTKSEKKSSLLPQNLPTMNNTFYRRKLPASCISFSSSEGRALFKKSLQCGYAEAFYPLIEQYHTQNEPAFCGLGTLTMILNALNVDPGRIWKGPWRWFSEEMLDCCVDLDKVRVSGITMDEFVCIARCNGALARVFRDSEQYISCPNGAKSGGSFSSPSILSTEGELTQKASNEQVQNAQNIQNGHCGQEEQWSQVQPESLNCDSKQSQCCMEANCMKRVDIELFRKHVIDSCRVTCQLMDGCEFGFVAVSYDRRKVGQTGSGHFSPIGAYCPSIDGKPDMVLVLDVARFKYPPHWISVEQLYDAMNTLDSTTGTKRGWTILARQKEKNVLNTALFVSLYPGVSVTELRINLSNLIDNANTLLEYYNSTSAEVTEDHSCNQNDDDTSNPKLIELVLQISNMIEKHLSGFITISDTVKKYYNSKSNDEDLNDKTLLNKVSEEKASSTIVKSFSVVMDELQQSKAFKLLNSTKLDLCDRSKFLYTLLLLALPLKGPVPWASKTQHNVSEFSQEIDKLKIQCMAIICYKSKECIHKSGSCPK